MPLYFRAVGAVHPAEILAHRIVWCALLLAGLLTVVGRWRDLARCLRTGRTAALLLASALLIAANWLVYIYGVWTQRILQTSLGYFVNPLFSVLLGMVFFRERLRPGQWAALTLAAAGLTHQVVAAGELPWIALAVAGSFGLYGLIRKAAPVDGLVGLTVETLLLLPAAAACLGCWIWAGTSSFGQGDATVDGLLLLSGVVTAVPLLCFGQAARGLRLSTLGFLQYLAPTVQFLLAVSLFGEPFRPEQRIAFGCTWAALAVFTAESVLARRRQAAPPCRPPVPAPRCGAARAGAVCPPSR
jgi:chloramphenicol-sensitive protein RarD